jgi:CRISPR-associated protein Cas1
MRHLLNTLYVTTQGAYLSREGETVLLRVEHETKLRVPIHTLGGIVCFGQVSCSPPLMELCGERNVAISFLSERGKFYARVQGPVSGNVLLRREQYRRADSEEFSAKIAQSVVVAKIANCRTVLLRAIRDHADPARQEQDSALEAAALRLARQLDDLRQPAALDAVRGVEGDAARTYFEVFDHLITAQKEDFFFHERSRRPPLDNLNALLSFFYTLLARPGRPSLALDLMEEFRPVLADRLALSLINRQQIRGKGFKKTETGAVLMDDATRKEVLVAYQKRKQEEIQHPFLGETVEVGLLPFVQAMLLARYLRGDLDGYPPFFWK